MFVKDHLSIYLDTAPFHPIIYDGSIFHGEIASEPILKNYNSIVVVLPSDMGSDLDWKKELEIADQAVLLNYKILWYFDFKLDSLKFSYDHNMQFEAFKLAVQTFSQDILPRYSKDTLGVLLYKGSSSSFFTTFKNAFAEGGNKKSLLDAADVFADYLRLFLPALPDEIMPFIQLSTKEHKDKAFLYRLLSKQRFEYFTLITEETEIFTSSLSSLPSSLSIGYIGEAYQAASPFFPNIGVLMPSDELFTIASKDINLIFEKVKTLPTRLVYETHLIEEIDGLDHLIIFEKGLSERGKRQVQGYCAAGGEVVTVGDLQGFVYEIVFDEFLLKYRGRGIRTPDLLVPNQPR